MYSYKYVLTSFIVQYYLTVADKIKYKLIRIYITYCNVFLHTSQPTNNSFKQSTIIQHEKVHVHV